MIKSIRLTRFKQFKDTQVQLRPFSVLMGENNAGKTTVLQAIWLALAGLHQGKLVSVDWKTGQAKVSSTGYPMYEIPFAPQGDLSGLFYNRIAREGQTYDENSGAMLQLTDEKDNCLRVHVRDLFRNLNFKVLTPAQELRAPELQNYAPLYISASWGLHFQEERLFPAVMEAKIAAGNADAIVRNIILDLKQQTPEKYHYLEKLMKEVFGFQIREVRFRENDERYICSEYEEVTQEAGVRRLEFGSAGSGILQILQIVAVILRYCPERTKVVLIDEPEAHLHGNLQVRFLQILEKMQKELEIQMILATHSEEIIRRTDAASVIPVSSYASVNHGICLDEELQSVLEEQLDAYQFGKVMLSGKLVFFEGRLGKSFAAAAQQLQEDCLFGLHTIAVVEGWHKSEDLPFDLAPLLGKSLGRKTQIHVICDADRVTEKELGWLQEMAERSGVKLHTVSGSALRKGEVPEEEIRMLLEALRPWTEEDRKEQKKKEERSARRDAYEQLSFFDL